MLGLDADAKKSLAVLQRQVGTVLPGPACCYLLLPAAALRLPCLCADVRIPAALLSMHFVAAHSLSLGINLPPAVPPQLDVARAAVGEEARRAMASGGAAG